MRPLTTIPILFLVLAACTGSESSAAENQAHPALTQQAKDAAVRARDEATANLDEWRAAAQRSLAGHEGRLEELRQRASSLAGQEKERLEAAIRELEPRRKEIAAKLTELGQQGEEAWTKAKPELDRLTEELKRLVDEHVK